MISAWLSLFNGLIKYINMNIIVTGGLHVLTFKYFVL